MFNLGTVIKFEILKQIRKPLFWLAVFATPALIILFGGVSYLGSKLSHEQTDKNKQQVAETSQKNHRRRSVKTDQNWRVWTTNHRWNDDKQGRGGN